MLELKEKTKILLHGINEILLLSEFEKRLLLKKNLNIKIGFDPTSPDIHLGHTLLLDKAKEFQQQGHNIIIIIGDFTGMIGDPSEKKNTRKQLSKEEVLINAQTYKNQIFKILQEENTKILFNSTWLNKITTENFIKMASKQTVAKMLQRDDFNKRHNNNESIHIHEFLYPLIQAYDSIIINSDLEIGGTDQKFNLLMGRDLQKSYNQKQQMIMTLPLLEGINGTEKMSKSLKNYIGINESPNIIFGKLMSISDNLMWKYIHLLCKTDINEINKLKNDIQHGKNPRDIKLNLSFNIVKKYHGSHEANKSKHNFIKQYIKKDTLNIKEHIIKLPYENDQIKITSLLKKINFTQSISEANRLIAQKTIEINNQKITNANLSFKKNTTIIIKLGKKQEKIIII
ncbi:MAG: tyrosine--tRNA ligase [Candidatus Azosocius agrarius]|nr:MAG: tyrosine--tRNA ligase [Gammaproteobacteria bacterium]